LSDGSLAAKSLLLRTWSAGEAAVVRQLLATYDIPCQVVSEVPHSVLPISIGRLGEILILVPSSLLAPVRALLAEHRREGFTVLHGGKAAVRRRRMGTRDATARAPRGG
jgi:hypothetical protein